MPMMKRTGSAADLISKVMGSGANSGNNTISATMSTKSKSASISGSSFGSITEFAPADFQDFLEDELSEMVDSNDLNNLTEAIEVSSFKDMLRELEEALNALLKSNQDLPPQVTAKLHTYLGLAYLELGNHDSAVSAFMRAIWFQSRTPEDTLAIAQANHRLGMAYALKKDYDQAIELIDRAIAGYDTSSDDYLTAKEDRHSIVEAQQLELLTKNGRYTIRQDMQQTVANNQRVARRERRRHNSNREKPKRRGSFSGLADVFSSIGGGSSKGPGLARQATAPVESTRTKSSAPAGRAQRRSRGRGNQDQGPGFKRVESDPLSLSSDRSPTRSPTRTSKAP